MAIRPRAQIGQPRIYGFMARSANSLLLLYRRRRKEIFVVSYAYSDRKGRKQDKLTVGARFVGRFYPNRCDLSPDGRHFIYFVMGGHQGGFRESYYCWTAMSRPPSLTALFLLPHQDTWGGGGAFLDDRTVIVSGAMHDEGGNLERLHMSRQDGVRVIVDTPYRDLEAPPKLPAPVARGWRETNPPVKRRYESLRVKSAKRTTLTARSGPYRSGTGDYDLSDYTLADRSGGTTILNDVLSRTTWADFDRQGRLVLAIAHELWIYDSPRPGMSEKPSRVIDLERLTEPG